MEFGKKSDLQKRLEAEGWTFLENEIINDCNSDENPQNSSQITFWRGVRTPTRLELQERYKTVYQEVRLEDAFDICGYPLSAEIVAIYARGRIKPEQR